MSKLQQRRGYQRTLSSAPDDLPEDAHLLYKTEERGCCPIFSSCVNSSEDTADTIHQEVPEKVSDILVSDPDTHGQDYRLEAKLSTFEVRDGDECSEYKRHMFTGINADGTASEMKLKNDDEIVLMNGDVFAPSITHNEVLQIFLKIKVDGRSSFEMVIRRKKVPGCCGGSGWTWIELSTTFTLKREIEHPIKAVTQSQLLRRNRMEMSFNSLYLYKIQGTQRYITIDNGHVYTDTLAGDESDMTKQLLKHEIVSQYRNEDFSFTVALSDHTRSWFIADDKKGRIVLRRKPCWFGFTCAGGIVTFKTKRTGNYLAYDHTNNQLRLRADRFCLEEIEVPQRRKQLFKR